MRELILVSLSAVLGYILFSAFSTSDSAEEAFTKIIEQPAQTKQNYQTVAINKINNLHQEKLIALDNKRKLEQLEIYSKLEMHNKEYETKISLTKLNNELENKLAALKIESKGDNKNKDNATFIVLAFLIFLLLFIYLKHKKHLNEIALEKQRKYDEMIARKDYSEKILAYISQGNLSFDTERKFLTILDELNGKTINPLEKERIYHPNPDIIELPIHQDS